MAQQTNPVSNKSLNELLVDSMISMDRIEWDLQVHTQGNAINSGVLEKINNAMARVWSDLGVIDSDIKSQDRQDYVAPHFRSGLPHLVEKHHRLKAKISTLVPNNAATVSHTQFQQKATVPNLQAPVTSSTYGSQQVAPSTLATKKVVSFTISPANSTTTQTAAAPSPSVILNRISYLLRNNNEAQALKEFNSLPNDIQQKVYLGMWIVRGRPMPGNPIAHENFGEVSFKNQEQRCLSTPQQKACAVELIKNQAALLEMKPLLEKNDNQGLRALFETLPSEVQNQIMGKHWEVCGKPTPQSREESLRNISHDNFGRVSFLGEDLRCEVPANKKIETVQACLADYEKKFGLAQTLTEQAMTAWTAIDKRPGAGSQKNHEKRAALLPLAKAIVPLFMGNSVPVQEPKFNGANYKGLAAEYIKAYPCLQPYFLQLVNDLNLGGALQDSTIGNQDTPKSSTPKDPNLGTMNHDQRTAYRTAIMQETYQTLVNGYYINSKGEKITLQLRPSLNSLKCATDGRGPGVRQGPHQTKIFLDKRDCLTVTRELTERGLNPIVLDAASNNRFGGGYKTGAGAQEEYLCRTSGLCFAADPTLGGQKKDFYPLDKNGPYAGLYVAHVSVFRGEEKAGYPYLDKPFETAVAIIAAPNFNEEHQRRNGVQNPIVIPEGGNIPEPQATEMVEKCRNVLQMAQDNGHNSVVLVALGCGAFRNPPKHVCEILGTLIVQEFPNSFKEVRIAIVDDHNTGMAHNPNGNYQAFKQTLERLNVRFVES